MIDEKEDETLLNILKEDLVTYGKHVAWLIPGETQKEIHLLSLHEPTLLFFRCFSWRDSSVDDFGK